VRILLRAVRHLLLSGFALDNTEETSLLVRSLEATVSHLGRSIDELEIDLLQSVSGYLWEKGFSKSDDSLLWAHDATSNHDPVLIDFTVVRETTHRGDSLLGEVVLGHGVVRIFANSLSNSVDLLVDLGSVVETVLTGSSNSERDSGRMPRTDTSNLSLTSVCLSGKDGNTPSLNDTSISVTLGDTDNINHFVLGEDGVDWDLLLEELSAEVNLIRDGSTVNLDFNNVGLLLTDLNLRDLSVHDGANDLAVLLGSGDLSSHLVVITVSLGVLGESLLLGLVPALIESASAFIAQVLGPDGSECSKAVGGFSVTNETNADHWWSLKDSDSLGDFLLVKFRARLLNISEDVSHTSLVTHEGGKMAWLGLIILGERLDLTLKVLSSLSWEETKRTAAWMFELSM
jgi:hypothetical protein